jgi:hypothetical protein
MLAMEIRVEFFDKSYKNQKKKGERFVRADKKKTLED